MQVVGDNSQVHANLSRLVKQASKKNPVLRLYPWQVPSNYPDDTDESESDDKPSPEEELLIN